jgi:hypothetical protein
MPRISSFYGISIWIYYDEIQHRGRPHFHARQGGKEASFHIEDLAILAGELPPAAARLVREWGRMHREELKENWRRARERQPLKPIAPLPKRRLT